MAEMGLAKARQVYAGHYAKGFFAFASFEADMGVAAERSVDMGVVKAVKHLFTQFVAGELRWETRASFAVMLTKTILKMSSLNGPDNTPLMWLLKGDGRLNGSIQPSDDQNADGNASLREEFGGLLALMAHGDPPASAENREVKFLSLSLSNWMAELFQMTKMSLWLERGRTIMVEAFKEEVVTIVQRINEATTGNVSELWQDMAEPYDDDKAWALIEKDAKAFQGNLQAFQDNLRPSASLLHDTVEAINEKLSPLLEDGRRMLSMTASLDATALVLGKVDSIEVVAIGELLCRCGLIDARIKPAPTGYAGLKLKP